MFVKQKFQKNKVVLLTCSAHARAHDVDTWILQGMKNLDGGSYEDALLCFDHELEIDNGNAIALNAPRPTFFLLADNHLKAIRFNM